jgi:hypothetical protein
MDKNSKDTQKNNDTLKAILDNYSIKQIREAFEIVEKERS